VVLLLRETTEQPKHPSFPPPVSLCILHADISGGNIILQKAGAAPDVANAFQLQPAASAVQQNFKLETSMEVTRRLLHAIPESSKRSEKPQRLARLVQKAL
jgi:hypothetical protein